MAHTLEPRPTDTEALKVAEQAIVQALLPWKNRLPADQVVIAMMRCARVLIRKLPKDTQKAIVEASTAYLSGKTKLPGESPIIQLYE